MLQVSFGPISWLIVGEIFPLAGKLVTTLLKSVPEFSSAAPTDGMLTRFCTVYATVRGPASAIATLTNFGSNFMVRS